MELGEDLLIIKLGDAQIKYLKTILQSFHGKYCSYIRNSGDWKRRGQWKKKDSRHRPVMNKELSRQYCTTDDDVIY